MTAIVETYRGVAIQRTAEVLGFPVLPESTFCFTHRHRREDDAPILDMARTVEQCRMEIDDLLDDVQPCAVEPINPDDDDEVFPPRMVRAGGRRPR